MRVQSVSNQNNQTNFGSKFSLSDKTIRSVEKTTGISYKELTELPTHEIIEKMEQSGKIKKPSKIRTWIADKYRKIGEHFGFIEPQFYTHID